MQWNDGIDGPHLAIAASGSRRIGVLAGPGTGKTSYGLMRRVVRLLDDEKTPGDRVLLLSFTRVAAADLRDKVGRLEAPGVEDVRATTLHGYCFGLLQRESVLNVTRRKPRILLNHEVDLMLRDTGGEFGNIYERRRRLEAFTAGWAIGTEDHPGIAGSPEDRDFGASVLNWLREHRAMLIGEVVPIAYSYLASNPAAEEFEAFDHVIVDEYQDLNVLEQALLDRLSSSANLCVAGDDDQSIYSVRYANPRGILDFLARADTEEHTIGVCGRCPANILSMANSLIGQAPGRQKDALEPRETEGDGVTAIVQWPEVEAEIDGLVSAIAGDIGSGIREPGQILVLTNWRKVGEAIRMRLNQLEIPARSYFTEEELASAEGREAIALLQLTADPDDAPALRVLLGLGDAAGRAPAYQQLRELGRNHRLTAAEILERAQGGERLGSISRALGQRYACATARAGHLRALALNELIDELFPESQIITADLRQIALDALPQAETVQQLLHRMVTAITQDEVPQNPDFVRIMSLHKSKGLTSDVVFVAGAVEGVLPTIGVDEPTEIAKAVEEGRRLFYVAVTRAAQELVISTALSMDMADANARGVRYDKKTIRRSGGRYVVKAQASQYIAELGTAAPTPVKGAAWLSAR